MVRAVAGDEFLDNGPQRRGRQKREGDAHGVSILRNTKLVSQHLAIIPVF
jgi:hypothetical protein